MTQSPPPISDSAVPENGQPENLDVLMEEIGTKQAHKLQLEQELASISWELARLNNKIVPLLTERISTDIENLKTRMIPLWALEEGGRLTLTLPDATKLKLRLDHNAYYYAHETKSNRHIELSIWNQPSLIRIYWIDTLGVIGINDDWTINQNTDTPITETLIEYTKILAWFQEQLTQMEDAKRAEKLAETIKKGE